MVFNIRKTPIHTTPKLFSNSLDNIIYHDGNIIFYNNNATGNKTKICCSKSFSCPINFKSFMELYIFWIAIHYIRINWCNTTSYIPYCNNYIFFQTLKTGRIFTNSIFVTSYFCNLFKHWACYIKLKL